MTLRADEILGQRPWVRARGTLKGPSGAQARHQLAAKSPAALNIERLGRASWEIRMEGSSGKPEDKAVGDLLRAPRSGPRPILTAAVAAADPSDVGP